jgi:hypothetical protein
MIEQCGVEIDTEAIADGMEIVEISEVTDITGNQSVDQGE